MNQLSAIQWKLLNINRLKQLNAEKHRALRDALQSVLY